MTDLFGRSIDYMRVSITDRCNLRCKYCMPEDLELLPRDEILTSEEIVRICRIASECGVRNIKITGGEPFARKNCMDIIREVAALKKIENVTVTTNGILLRENLDELQRFGVNRINISLDTFDQKAYYQITGKDEFLKVYNALLAAIQKGFNVKINCIPIRGFNEDQLIKMAEFARLNRADVRFIETMPIGLGRDFEGISSAEIFAMLAHEYPSLRKIEEKRGFGPAKYYTADGFKGAIGFIDAVTGGFCGGCNRIRLTSEGFLKSCLAFESGVDLRALLRNGAPDSELSGAFEKAVSEKPEQHLFGTGGVTETRGMSKIGG